MVFVKRTSKIRIKKEENESLVRALLWRSYLPTSVFIFVFATCGSSGDICDVCHSSSAVCYVCDGSNGGGNCVVCGGSNVCDAYRRTHD